MKRTLVSIAAISAVSLLVSGCGLNPFGPSQGGLSLFANIGKAMQKPSAINDDKNSKQGTKAIVGEASGTAKRLAKIQGAEASDSFIIHDTIVDSGNGLYAYCQQVRNKPGEEDPENKWTGTGVVLFTYNGPLPTKATVDTSKILGIKTFYFVGNVNKTWKLEIDSVSIGVRFTSVDKYDPKPGHIWAWGRNISGSIDKGDGDTAYFALDSLDDVNHVQFGEGHFLDLHTGEDNSGDAYAFNFNMKVIFINTLEPAKPYQRWQDNEGEVTFVLPWGKNAVDSLHFNVHLYPNYQRSGTIADDKGTIRVRFTHNEKTGVGDAIFYDKDGVETPRS
jgi:hypothetical protein